MFRFFLQRPFLVNLSIVLIVISGLIAASRMRREALPDVDQRMVYVTTAYPGAAAAEVSLNITTPLEREIRGVDGVERVRSVSRSEISRITVSLDRTKKRLNDVKQQIRRAVDRAVLPSAVVQSPLVTESRVADMPILEVVLSADKKNLKLYKMAFRLRDICRRLNGVSRVNLLGWSQREIQVLVNPAALNAKSVTLSDVVSSLKAGNPSGIVALYEILILLQD